MSNPEHDPLDIFREFGLRIIPSPDFKKTLSGLACQLARLGDQPFTPFQIQTCQGIGRKGIRAHFNHLEALDVIRRLHPPRSGMTPHFTFTNTEFSMALQGVLRENPPTECKAPGTRINREPSPQESILTQLVGARIQQGWTQTDIGRILGIKQNTVSSIENGGDPKLSTLLAYIAALGGTINLTFPDQEAADFPE